VVTDSSKRTKWYHNPEVAEVIRNYPYLNKMWDDIEVDYYDSDIVGDWEEMKAHAPLQYAVPQTN